jgi:hypothetical protein
MCYTKHTFGTACMLGNIFYTASQNISYNTSKCRRLFQKNERDCSLCVRKVARNETISPSGELSGARGCVVVKALRYKPAGRGFDSR